MNKFSKLLVNKAEERFSIDSTTMPMTEWICKNTTLKKRPFSFKGYEFQRQIVDDMHPDMSVIKISQVGLTEVQIRKALAFLVRNRGTSLIFSLPDEVMFERVSKARVKPIIAADKVFNSSEDKDGRSVRSTELMQFGQSFLYLVPALESAATSISADFVMNDEVDLSDQKMITLFNSRLQASKFKLSQKFSTPSFPSYGIDLNWQTSDQHFYMCRCDACGHIQHPEFNRNFIHLPGMPDDIQSLTDITVNFQDLLNFNEAYVKCERCERPLDLNNPDNRMWISKFPSRTQSRGYRVGPFSTPNLTIPYIFKQLWDYQKNEYMRGFHNTVLGNAYSDGSIQIPTECIMACMTASTMPPDLNVSNDLWVGVDMGQICHITIGIGPDAETMDIISMYQVRVDEIVDHLKGLCEKYPIRGGCVDRHPYEPTSRAIMEATNGRIIPVEYRGLKDVNPVFNEYDELSYGQVNRTWFLDKVASRFRKRDIRLSGYGYQKQAIIEHYRDMVREETPEKPAEWKKLNGNDHYFHATGFMLLAPKLAEIAALKSKADLRSLSLTTMLTVQDHTSNLTGVSNKRLDSLG